jgi:hypothetical protein
VEINPNKFRRLRLGLKLATAIGTRMPHPEDGYLTKAVKYISVFDAVADILQPGRQNGAADLVDRYDLVACTNAQFVSVFFDTKLREEFQVSKYNVNEYLEVTEAKSKRLGDLYFTEYKYGEGEKDPVFYHSKGFLFEEVLTSMWDTYEGRIHVSSTPNLAGQVKHKFSRFGVLPNPLYGAAKDLMVRRVAQHRTWVAQGVPRTYMFFGPPGTGKTSFAMEFASRLGDRIMKLDAATLAHCEVAEMTFLLDGLKPDFVIIDDLDKAEIDKVVPTILTLIEKFQVDFPNTTVLLTANNTDNFDPGLLRPSRVSTWFEFHLPDADTRREVLGSYMEGEDQSYLPTLIEATEGLSEDYLKEVARLARECSLDEVINTVELMKRLLKSNQESDSDDEPDDDD